MPFGAVDAETLRTTTINWEGMSTLRDPLSLRWVFFTTVLASLFGTALLLGVADSTTDVLFLVAVALGVSALYLPGVQAAIGDDRVQIGALFVAMGLGLLVMHDGTFAPSLFLAIGALFLGLCVRDRRVESGDPPTTSP